MVQFTPISPLVAPPKTAHFMIKNYTFARNIRAFTLRAAEKALTVSRSVSQCRKRRVRQPRMMVDLRLTPSQARFAFPHKLYASRPITHPQQARMSRTEIVRWFWENNTFQTMLHRPYLKPVAEDAVAMVDSDMADMTIQELTLGLHMSSGEIRPWGPVADVVAEPPSAVLPKEMEMVTDDIGLSTCPTHMLAVYPPAGLHNGHPRRVRLYPVQGFLVALFCSRTRVPPSMKPLLTPVGMVKVEDGEATRESPAKDTMTIHTTAIRLPVAHLCLPEPGMFPLLLNFFHRYSVIELRRNILRVDLKREPDLVDEEYKWQYAKQVALDLSPEMIRLQMYRTYAFWRNIVALGISDEVLWSEIYFIFQVLGGARVIQMRRPDCYPQVVRP